MPVALSESLIAALMTATVAISGDPPPARMPGVVLLPVSELQDLACVSPCAVEGWFPPGDTIYLNARLDPTEDLWAQGIVVHEMVHYLQHLRDLDAGVDPLGRDLDATTRCIRRMQREFEAHRTQFIWLRRAFAAADRPFMRPEGHLRPDLRPRC